MGRNNFLKLPAFVLLFLMAGLPAYADEYPGVYADDGTLVFVQAGDSNGLQGIVVLTYEFSMDWVITVAELGVRTDAGIVLTNGHQYVYHADGVRRSVTEFTSMDLALGWDALQFQILPSYGRYLAPMLRGGLAYSLVETRAGLPSQLVLAKEAYESGDVLNLYEGFLYQVTAGEISAQIAFTEVAFGNQGLVRGNFPENFPPLPEDYPSIFPNYPAPNYMPPYQGSGNSSSGFSEPYNPTLPQGTLVPENQQSNRRRFNLDPIHNYDVPPLTRIGVVSFRSYGEIEGFETACDEMIQSKLGDLDGVEIVYIPFDSNLLGGLVIYDRAVWLCEYYGVQALLLNEINVLEIPGGIATARSAGTFRINTRISGSLIDGYGGGTIWEQEFESQAIHDAYEAERGVENVLKSDLRYLINQMVDGIKGSGVLNGGHYD